ncbi:acetylxylan esterase [Parabacteroides provencensis]|uniref:acetylxylan esterase n=1 Tax=Parabacteroides provencensis TaxID=1944636 RepID=UPI000C14DCD8|nr:acetylxylan esterase [Parabacteroides provencensis]
MRKTLLEKKAYVKRTLSLFILIFCSIVTAQAQSKEITVMVSPDKADCLYTENEPCTFTIRVFKAQNELKGVTVDYELGPIEYPAEKKTNQPLKNGKLEVKGRMSVPGFLRCKVTAHVNGRDYSGLATVGYAPEKIKPVTDMPKDFKTYWDSTLDKARQTELNPTMVLLPERCTDKVNVYHVSFQNVRPGSRTYGILCIPKKEGKYPALLRVPGAGIRPYNGDVYTASQGAITLEIGIHGIPVTMTQSFYNNLFNGALKNYWQINNTDRDAFYYNRVIAGCIRAVDFLCSLEQFDNKTLGVAGSSQGGALSVITAALDKRVTFYAPLMPGMCDHLAYLEKRAGGWPHYLSQSTEVKEAVKNVCKYYDVVNFAKFLTVPGWFSWGYNDETCPPTSMQAAYNTITSPKELHIYPQDGHFWYDEQAEEWSNWIWKQLNIN